MNMHTSVRTDVRTEDNEPVRVLFVEDEFFIREWIEQSLAEQGFAVESVTNAADALSRISRGRIDVLLTDINLSGGMDGAALARRARELRPGLAVIYASAHAASLSSNTRVPGSVVLSKPYEPGVLGRLLATAVRTMPAALSA
jgi:two-component system, response regulator PdtaR